MSALPVPVTAVVVSRLMGEAEARQCVRRINGHLESARTLLLELHERQGWRALGYKSWRECVTQEFERSQSQMYRMLEAASIERDISPAGERDPDSKPIPERTLRPLSPLSPEQRRSAWQEAQEEAEEDGEHQPTTARVEDVAARVLAGMPADRRLAIIQGEEDKLLKESANLGERHRRDAIDKHRDQGVQHLRLARQHFHKMGPEGEEVAALTEEVRKKAVAIDLTLM